MKGLLRRLAPLRKFARGGSISPYRPKPGERLVVLSPAMECAHAGRDLEMDERGWFWKCRDCSGRYGPFASQRVAEENWHRSVGEWVGGGS
jgi:hypothetical protein